MFIPMPARRLEDRIRELCARPLTEQEPEWSLTLKEFQLALREHILRIENLAAAVFVAGTGIVERREK